jgi:5-methylcytosine-specific restriction enzyme subunit McrC
MRELLEVKEFETISGNREFKNQYKYMDKGAFDYLLRFIHEYDTTGKNSDILDFIKIGYRRNVGETVTFKNYVGLIQVKDNYQIQILPKIDFVNGEKDNTKRVFLKMLRSMKDFPSRIFSESNLKMDRMNIYEIFINMYLQETRELVRLGLKSAYVNVEDNLNFYKGKLLTNEHIRNNFVHKERFFVGFDEYQINRPENRLVKATLLKLQELTESFENAKEIRRLLTAFELVKPSVNYDKDFSEVIIDRNTKEYETLIKWSKVFLKNKSFTTFSGTDFARALLFPMDKVFESYVAKNMKKIFSRIGWQVSLQDKGYYLFDMLNGESHKKFALRPDIVVTKDNGNVVIMDTKWKNLTNNKSENFGISQADMYQMYAYSKKYNTPDVWLLYPMNETMKNQEIIKFASTDGVNVSVYFVDVANIEGSLEKFLLNLNGACI